MSTATRERRILLVEDNADDEKLTLRALRKNNFANPVDVARDGEEALGLLHGAEAANYALVLLDLRLPRVRGLEVLQRMRADARTRLLPVVVLTSSNEDRDLVASYELGANSYVRKPVDFAEFVGVAARLGTYWLLLNETAPAEAATRTSA